MILSWVATAASTSTGNPTRWRGNVRFTLWNSPTPSQRAGSGSDGPKSPSLTLPARSRSQAAGEERVTAEDAGRVTADLAGAVRLVKQGVDGPRKARLPRRLMTARHQQTAQPEAT